VRIPAGEADLLLGCDLVVTTTYEAMGKAARGRTHTVVNSAEVPTSAFILDPDAKFPTLAMQEKVINEVGEEDCHFIDATRIATRLLGDSIASNLFLLGFAWQRGLVPVSAEALEQAIDLNGVAAQFNKQAFLWGRRCADQPEKVMRVVGDAGEAETAPRALDLDATIADRIQRLTDYQNAEYAQRYANIIDTVRNADPRAQEADSITQAAARNLFKLMAYKDEYEVARLHSNSEFKQQLQEKFEGDFELRFNLAPPLFSKRDPETGHLLKREFGPWMMQAFAMLAPFKFLRGTRFDLFGYTAERRQERRDIDDYIALLEQLMAGLDEGNYVSARELAQMPRKLRGFGHVKDRNRELLALQQAQLMRLFTGDNEASPVKIVEAA
jgi:indolepyruvate ferredoxin oxidoreductase